MNIEKETIKRMYEKEKLNTYEIANKLGCSQGTIWNNLKKYRIKTRKRNELRSKVPSKEELIRLYTENRLSTWEIQKRYGYSRSTIHLKLKEFNIQIRNRSESHIIYPKFNFSGDLIEKAYLIGFRIGDLGVRKQYTNSRTITIASGSTIQEQINLINNLFKAYSKVWIKRCKEKTNVQIIVNESFSFLLSKDYPSWIEKNEDYFYSFLAGFTDAEGNISISNNMAYFGLGNYDKLILFKIYEHLNKLGVICNKPLCSHMEGKFNKQGFRYNADYWSLRIHRKKYLLELLKNLSPYLKHENKVKALNIAITNIIERNKINDK
jgi:predicted DNA-binding protein YlxM (UPF0122 family)